MEETNNNQALIDAVRDGHRPEVVPLSRGTSSEAAVIALPKGNGAVELVSTKKFLDEFLEKPERIEGTARVTTLSSFIDLVKRYATPESALFANDDPKAPGITCVLDYHTRRREVVESAPNWARHRIVYDFPLSEQWNVWKQPREKMTQETFATFLEDHLDDVMDPGVIAGSKTLDLCDELGIRPCSRRELQALAKGLEVRIEQTFIDKRNLDNGNVSLVFQETSKDEQGLPLVVPNGFLVMIPVFRGGDPYALPIRLRFKPQKPAVVWSLSAYRIEQALRDAFGIACATAAKETDLPLFYGSPETTAR